MADSDSILQLGIEAARAGDKAEARELFRLVTRENPDNAQGWLWLAGVAENRDEKRAALERVVALEPHNDLAQKGLAAIGGARAASPPPAPDAAPAAVPTAPMASTAATPSLAEVPAAAAPAPPRARQYDVPDAAPPDMTPPAAAGAGSWTAPTYDAEEFDLPDYQQTPRSQPPTQAPAVALDPQIATGTRVVVEDEEPAGRRRLGWLPLALALVILVLIGAYWWGSRTPDDSVPGVAGDNAGQPAATLAAAGADGAAALLGTESTATSEPGGTPLPAEGTAGPAQEPAATEATAPVADVTAPPAEATAPPAADVTVPPAVETAPPVEVTAPPVEATPPPTEATAPPPEATPAPAEETIVVVAPGATVAPTPEAPLAAPPTAAPPPAAGDIAAANPAIVPVDTVVQAGSWGFTYSGVKNVTSGSYGGGPPSRGQYQIVLMAVANNGGAPAPIPDGFFVLKDAQGRV
ncbi:MAG TPA: hypothetical protein VEZ12_08625, partial [Herpetosiphonaceae bacterium]|nr:hypothetical protein [Herpetosiphonaceae bacterium]